MMNYEVLEKLNAYCSELLGEVPSNSKEKKNSKKKNDGNFNLLNKKKLNKISQDQKTVTKHSEDADLPTKVTEDGFKIVSKIPTDDSNISDAFSSDLEDGEDNTNFNSHALKSERESKSRINETEDGFKILSDIPPDDCDLSDAFESDLDESEWLNEAQQRLNEKKNSQIKLSSNTNEDLKPAKALEESQFQSIKKPLMKLIKDFDMEDKLFLNKNSEPCLKRTLSSTSVQQSKKRLPNKEIMVIDYSSKRGREKVKEQKDAKLETSTKNPKISKKDIDSSFKKTRYEVFKFGLSAFEKDELKNAKIELAVRLGARPPKKASTNYKKLIEERKRKKKEVVAKREEEREMGLPVKKPVENKQRKKNDVSINHPIGKFKDGVLTLSKKDIEGINSRR